MNFSNVPANGAIRLWLDGEQLTKRIPVKSINSNPTEYVNAELKSLQRNNCTVEVLAKAGNSFLSVGKFDYSMQQSMEGVSIDKTAYAGNYVSHFPPERTTYIGNEGILAKHYEKCYHEEYENSRKLRIELNNTTRELNTAKIELELIGQRNELENMRKDLEREQEYRFRELEYERNAKSGLGGLMDTIEKNPFLQGLIEKLIDNYFNKPKEGLSGVSNIDDPDIKQAITGITNTLAGIAKEDKEHFAYNSLIIDKINNDKDMAQYLYRWMNSPQEPSVTDKAEDKKSNSNTDVL